MKRKVTILSALCLLALATFLASNPLRRSEANIRSWLEMTTPIGSKLPDVQSAATERGWYHAKLQGSDGQTSGTYIRGELGDYQGLPFRTSVTVFWEFNASDQLTNIRVWKTSDGI
jgi:hypothetical protein